MKSSSVTPPVPSVLLLVDDNLMGLQARKSILNELGYVVETARSAEEALEVLPTREFHLMVTDYKLPRMNGLDLIVAVRAQAPATRIILLTGFADSMGLHEANTHADAVLMKSAGEVSQLVRTVKKLLTAKRKPQGKASSAAAGANGSSTAASPRTTRKKR